MVEQYDHSCEHSCVKQPIQNKNTEIAHREPLHPQHRCRRDRCCKECALQILCVLMMVPQIMPVTPYCRTSTSEATRLMMDSATAL